MDDWREQGMVPTRNQRTIGNPAVVEGIGYWSGRDVRVEFRPAKEDTGIVFVRTDLKGCPRIPALLANWTETPLRTTLCREQAGVDMIEHLMAALAGMQIDNCEIWVNQQEMPGCDGSSMPIVEALDAAGLVELQAVRTQKIVQRTLRLGDDDNWIEARPCCSGKMVLQYEMDYGSTSPIGHQSLEMVLSPESFRKELASSRTFILEQEAVAFRARGLGRRATCRDLLVLGRDGPIDNQLRFPDECVRHKLLDMVGDLALAGCDLVGRFLAYRSGHRLNAQIVREVLADTEVPGRFKRCA